MSELFGIPLGTLLTALAIILGGAGIGIAVLALRNPILVRLGLRGVGRRRGRTTLIVLGLMLGTAIIAAALTTGDTMSHTIRSTTVTALGATDEAVTVRGATEDIPGDLGQATGVGYFSEAVADRVEQALSPTGLVDGVTPIIVEGVALQAPVQRRTEPSANLFAADPDRMDGFSAIRPVGGGSATLGDLAAGEAFVNTEAADELGVAAGDTIRLYAGDSPVTLRVHDVVRFDGAATADAALLLPLAAAQEMLGRQGEIAGIAISNRGDELSGVGLSEEVAQLVKPIVEPLGLEVATVKQDAIDTANDAANAFVAFFTTFGTFSIAAGILLVFLIFVMLAAERRGELGIARAVGTRRGHLVEMFLFEGLAYDLAAAAVGTVLGAGVAYGMVLLMAQAFGAADEDAGLQIAYAVTGRSLLVAAAIGILMTLAVVAFSAWKVSVMTIATAIRNLPEPPVTRRRRVVLGTVGIAFGGLLTLAGISSSAATPLLLGLSLVLIGAVPILCALGAPDRPAFTTSGLAVIALWLLPWSILEDVFGPLKMDFSTWIASGLMIVVGAVWTIVYNADLVLGAVMAVVGRIPRLAPIVRVAVAYPLAGRFRTGTTLAMFTLVVFTLVCGTAVNGSFLDAASRTDLMGGGFDVRAGTGGALPVTDLATRIRSVGGLAAGDVVAVGSQSVLAVDATQLGTDGVTDTYPLRGLDDGYLDHTTLAMGALARGYTTSEQVWQALRDDPGLAIADSTIAPRRDNFNFGVPTSDFKLTGFVFDDPVPFEPIPVRVRDPQTGRTLDLTVIGILSETAPWEMIGLSTSQLAVSTAFPGRTAPTVHYVALAEGVDPDRAARQLESAFLANGMEAQSIREVVHDARASSITFSRLIQGFMGLGLVVGVAALGVVSARAVVERRQQIGVLRAIGFRRGMVEAMFLVESAFVALTAIAVGAALGLLLAGNIVRDQRSKPSWHHLELVVPWTNLVVVFAIVLAVALSATLAPALRASRVRPAEALRYQ